MGFVTNLFSIRGQYSFGDFAKFNHIDVADRFVWRWSVNVLIVCTFVASNSKEFVNKVNMKMFKIHNIRQVYEFIYYLNF